MFLYSQDHHDVHDGGVELQGDVRRTNVEDGAENALQKV